MSGIRRQRGRSVVSVALATHLLLFASVLPGLHICDPSEHGLEARGGSPTDTFRAAGEDRDGVHHDGEADCLACRIGSTSMGLHSSPGSTPTRPEAPRAHPDRDTRPVDRPILIEVLPRAPPSALPS